MRNIAIGAASAVLATAATLGSTMPAQAQPIAVGNLVNVQITNVLNNNQVAVQIPINAAANICGVTVAVIANVVDTGKEFECRSRSGNRDLVITQ